VLLNQLSHLHLGLPLLPLLLRLNLPLLIRIIPESIDHPALGFLPRLLIPQLQNVLPTQIGPTDGTAQIFSAPLINTLRMKEMATDSVPDHRIEVYLNQAHRTCPTIFQIFDVDGSQRHQGVEMADVIFVTVLLLGSLHPLLLLVTVASDDDDDHDDSTHDKYPSRHVTKNQQYLGPFVRGELVLEGHSVVGRVRAVEAEDDLLRHRSPLNILHLRLKANLKTIGRGPAVSLYLGRASTNPLIDFC
jgi:hypothetical protein